jgi:hypothetical protein
MAKSFQRETAAFLPDTRPSQSWAFSFRAHDHDLTVTAAEGGWKSAVSRFREADPHLLGKLRILLSCETRLLMAHCHT